jgi:ketosteroid isomerase-like protein
VSQHDAVLKTEQDFFDALVRADRETLGQILTDDFTIVDVMAGNVVPKQPFIDFVASGGVKFHKIDRLEADARFYGDAAVIVGRTHMEGSFQDQPFTAESRYTHVFVGSNGQWSLAAAQGTQIKEMP